MLDIQINYQKACTVNNVIKSKAIANHKLKAKKREAKLTYEDVSERPLPRKVHKADRMD